MSGNDGGVGKIISVLLADGWHRTVPGSFSVAPTGFGPAAELGVPGFRFEEADVGSPYRPTVLAGPLDSIIAVRQVASAIRSVADTEDPRTSRIGRGTAYGDRLPTRAGRRAAEA